MPEIATMDYSGARLLIEATTPIERAYRAHAAAKEPWTVEFIEGLDPARDVFYDVGANTGPYTLIAAARGITTVAIEPHYESVAALHRNVLRNGLAERVIVVPGALWDETGLTRISYSDMRSGSAGHTLGGRERQSFHWEAVLTYRLDDLVSLFGLPSPTHAKIDVDGHERRVLAGMEGVLGGTLRELILEMPLKTERLLTGWLAERGWERTARYDERGGQRIGDICYGRFAREGG